VFTPSFRLSVLVPFIALLSATGAGLSEPATSGARADGTMPPAEGNGGVIGFDLCILDGDGLIGPPDGKRALDYEFCIPAGEGFAAEVRAIDASAAFFEGSRGRIGCGPDQVLVIGNTHRPDFAFVLQRLSELPYVARIEQAHFE
jgi:hypothetical protein